MVMHVFHRSGSIEDHELTLPKTLLASESHDSGCRFLITNRGASAEQTSWDVLASQSAPRVMAPGMFVFVRVEGRGRVRAAEVSHAVVSPAHRPPVFP
jgi:hypothetical protein